MQRRGRVLLLRFHGERDVLSGERQPGCARAEATPFSLPPGHWRAAAIAPLEARPESNAVGIAQRFEGHVGLAQAQFLALVNAHRASERADQRCQLRGQVPRRIGASPAAEHALHVVVGNGPAGPGLRRRRQCALDSGADVRGRAFRAEQFEGVAHVQAAGARVFRDRRIGVFGRDLAERHGTRIAVGEPAELFDEGHILGPRVVVHVVLIGVGVVGQKPAAGALLEGLGRVVAQLPIVEAEIDGIKTHAIDAAIEPEAHVVQRRAAHFRVVKIQVGLRAEKIVEVVLRAPRFPLPGNAPKDRQPVVGRTAVGPRVGPHVPGGAGVAAILPALDEPGVFRGGMAEHLVDHHLEAQAVRLAQQTVEVLQRAEQRIDSAIVGNVIAEIGHRRLEEGRDPDGLDAETRHVVEPLDDARQVTDTIAVGVEEAARIDLVDGGAMPPGRLLHRGDSLLVLECRALGQERPHICRTDSLPATSEKEAGTHTYS